MITPLVFLFFIFSITSAQETPSQLMSRFAIKYQKCTDANLLSFAGAAHECPKTFLEMASLFYTSQAQKPENSSWWTSIQTPFITLKKAIVYVQLSRSINQQVYGQQAKEILEKMNEPLNDTEGAVKTHETHFDQLTMLADDQNCAEQASRQFAREWPFHVIPIDLESYKNRLVRLHQEFESQKQQLTLSEQNDNLLEAFKIKLESNIISLERAINVIIHRKIVETIHENPIAFIIQQMQCNCLKEALETYGTVFPLNKMNDRVRAQHTTGNSIFHEICLTSSLTPDQKINALNILDKQNQLCINYHNNENKTALDLLAKTSPENEHVIQTLISLGGKHSLPKLTPLASAIKKSNSDSARPSLPDNAKLQTKRQLRFSFDTKTQP